MLDHTFHPFWGPRDKVIGMWRWAVVLLAAGAALAADPEVGVSRDLARRRAEVVRDLRYRLSLEVRPGAEQLTGVAEIRFRLTSRADPLVLDFRDDEGDVSHGMVNGRPAGGLRRVNGHVLLPGRLLRRGENTVQLAFRAAIATSGRPVIRYLDRDDGSEYVYTLFVPMDASLAFPCFDQPDLKGRFTLELTAPEGWTAVSNGVAAASEPGEAGYTRRRFAETKPISTYLFAFAAGPFRELRAPAGAAPYRLLVPRSKLARAEEEWPEVLRTVDAGLRHFAAFFDFPFPFPKYDQVLIPGLAYGGMEHAGATFLNEETVLFRTVPTAADRTRRRTLLLHELCHQWFGDLVTMRWFDDLWLKEGFANYMAYQALAALEPPDAVWKRFYETIKPAAYRIDGTKGTTPVHQELRNLSDAKSAYGEIVYSKAPGLLRTLSFTVGETAFREGLRLYLKEHAWGNATWEDLVAALAKASGQKLDAWAQVWVNRRGMPEVTVDWACDGEGKIRRLALAQRDVLGEGGVWPIRTRVLLAYEGGRFERVEARLSGARAEVPEAAGRPCPAYVFANDQDEAYGRFLLDERSRHAVMTQLGGVRDPFLRALLWGALWDGVREAQVPPLDYLRLAIELLPGESDEESAATLLARVGAAFQGYLSDEQRAEVRESLEGLLEGQMRNAATTGLRITFFRSFVGLAGSERARGVLKDLLAERTAVPGVDLKPLDRWRMVTALLARGDGEAAALLRAEAARDTTDDGKRYAWIAAAAERNAAIKRRYFDDYLKNRERPEYWVQGSLGAFNAWDQAALTLPYLQPALEALPAMKQEHKIFFVLAWLEAFIGGQQAPEALATVEAFLEHAAIDGDLRLKVLQVQDELERKVRVTKKLRN